MEQKQEKKIKPVLRKLMLISGSLYVCIPKKIAENYKLSPGGNVAIVANGGLLTIVPIHDTCVVQEGGNVIQDR